jgi:hypothetical protein
MRVDFSVRRKSAVKWISELLIIMVGVLAALAVDDWVQRQSDRRLEAHLLERLSKDLVTDAGDLAIAQVQVMRRQWLFDALAAAMTGTAPSHPPDSLLSMERHAALLDTAGRSVEAEMARGWENPLEAPLLVLRGAPDFDVSDGSYKEILATGALRTLEDSVLRSAVITYYWTAEDMRINVMNAEQHLRDFSESLRRKGVSIGDEVSIHELVDIVSGEPYIAAQVRHIVLELEWQLDFLNRIEQARLALEKSIAANGKR